MKRCTKCGEEKPTDLFYRRGGVPTSWCKACLDRSNRASYERNKTARNRQVALSARARKLGMTLKEYLALEVDPGRECAICGVGPDDPRNGYWSNGKKRGPRNLAVDHSHTNGRLRGFLCQSCNQALGLAGDDPSLLRKMADYLERGAEFPALGNWRPRPQSCTIEGCAGPVHGNGLCDMHYARLARTGTTDDPPARPQYCAAEGCERAPRTRGLCSMHYKRLRRTATLDARPNMGSCSEEGCEVAAKVKGLCMRHYDSQRRMKVVIV